MTVPEGIEVVDQRLVAHGFTAADGVVLEGKVTDLATGQPIAATMRLQRVEPQQKGGYLYPVVAEAKADAQGHWVLKKAPAGWVRVVVEADGFVPRVAGYARFDEQPRWQSYDCGLARSAPVSGRVTDEDGKPLADVDVRLDNVQPESGGRYESPLGVHVQDRRRRPLPGRAGAGGHGDDLGPQAGLLPPRPGPCRSRRRRATSSCR